MFKFLFYGAALMAGLIGCTFVELHVNQVEGKSNVVPRIEEEQKNLILDK